MFSAIRPSHRQATPIGRLTAGLPDLPRRKKKRHLPVGADQIVRAGLAALPIGATAVIFRDKLASIVSRGDDGEEQAPDTAEE